MATDKNGKLTYEMKSPGQAWMDHVNNDLNAKAVTPAYLEPRKEDGPGVRRILKCIQEMEKQQNAVTINPDKAKALDKEDQKKDRSKTREIGHSR